MLRRLGLEGSRPLIRYGMAAANPPLTSSVSSLKRPQRARMLTRGLTSGSSQQQIPPPRKRGETTRLERVRLALMPYRIGVRKLFTNIKVVYHALMDSVFDSGRRMSRRERRLIFRTLFDMSKLLPFAFLAAAPGGSLLLPVLAKVFPKSLPTTFNMPAQQKLVEAAKSGVYNEEEYIRERMDADLKRAVNEIGRTLHENQLKQNSEIRELLEHVVALADTYAFDEPSHQLFLSKFSDEDILDALNMQQMESLAKHLNLPASLLARLGSDRYRFSIMRHQLEKHVTRVNSEDNVLAEEGTSSLSEEDFVQVCLDRGLCTTSGVPPLRGQTYTIKDVSVPRVVLEEKLKVWLHTSTRRHAPPSLMAFADMKSEV